MIGVDEEALPPFFVIHPLHGFAVAFLLVAALVSGEMDGHSQWHRRLLRNGLVLLI